MQAPPTARGAPLPAPPTVRGASFGDDHNRQGRHSVGYFVAQLLHTNPRSGNFCAEKSKWKSTKIYSNSLLQLQRRGNLDENVQVKY